MILIIFIIQYLYTLFEMVSSEIENSKSWIVLKYTELNFLLTIAKYLPSFLEKINTYFIPNVIYYTYYKKHNLSVRKTDRWCDATLYIHDTYIIHHVWYYNNILPMSGSMSSKVLYAFRKSLKIDYIFPCQYFEFSCLHITQSFELFSQFYIK